MHRQAPHPHPRFRPTRRSVLRGGGAAALVAASSGCSWFSTDPADEEATAAVGAKGKEAPMLAALVEKGELPPVEERLPTSPLVVEPNDAIGIYGGEWRSATLGVADWPWLGRTVGYENLTRWNVEWTETIPNLAEEFSYNDDATELTFRLREGIKWSDGKPFTADDIAFAIDDIFLNPTVYPEATSVGLTFQQDDELTFRLVFEDPDALWASYDILQYQIVAKPRHYLEQFHRDYNPDVERLVEEEGADSWVALLDTKAGITDSSLYWQNGDIPTLNPWRMIEPLGTGSRVTLERNPYYWKTDPDGSQLPYLDRVVFDVILDEEVMLTRALNGDFDMHMRHFNTLQNKPVLAAEREGGGFDFFDSRPSEMNTSVIALNLAHPDPVLREVFQNKDFRIALSHAIDRQEIIDVVYQQQGEPWQAAPRRESPFFDEELATQFTEYDVDLANQLLDEAGYDQRDDAGIRLGPSGDPIAFTLSVPTGFRPDINDSADLVQGYWQEVGIDVQVRGEERSLFYERKDQNLHDANVWSGDNGLIDSMLDPRWYCPTNSGESNYAQPWAKWYSSDGEDESGEEPPQSVKDHLAIYDRLIATPDPEGQYEVMKELLATSREQFYAIGVNLTPPGYGIVATDFRNVPAEVFDASLYNNPGPTNPEQYFIET